MMPPWQSVAAVLLALPAITVTIDFAEEGSVGPCGTSQQCLESTSCPAYFNLAAVQRDRSNICGFSGLLPRVCCDTEPATTAPPPGPDVEPTSATHPALPTNCGKPSYVTLHPPYNKFAFVLGGGDADLSKWPWMVLLGRWTSAGLGDWFCGGTLITDRHVLTAAHCLRPEEAGTVGARIGDTKLTNTLDVQDRNVSLITRHPRYISGRHDLAVVQLAEPVELGPTKRPICLPAAGAEHVGQDVEVAGRGLLEFGGEPAEVLQEAPLRVTDPAACEAAYRRLPAFGSRFSGGFQGTTVSRGTPAEATQAGR